VNNRIKNLLRRFDRAYKRMLARSLPPMATFQARLALRKTGPLRILVDNTVLGHAITHETGWISTGTKLWGGQVPVETGYTARIPVHSPSNDKRVYREVRYLAGIAHLARQQNLQLCTSAELAAERFRQPMGRFRGYGSADFNVFQGVEMESVDGIHLDLVEPKTRQRQRIAACDDPLLKAILAELPAKMSQDAYHIFTAEKFGLYGFLHIDFGLAEQIKQKKGKPPFSMLRTRILLPSELGKSINLVPFDPHGLPLAGDDDFFPTHADMHFPEQRRRPVSRYKRR
jgi:hypothetical protein